MIPTSPPKSSVARAVPAGANHPDPSIRTLNRCTPLGIFRTVSQVIEGSFGTYVVGRGRRVGSALLQATSEGKTGQASITVH